MDKIKFVRDIVQVLLVRILSILVLFTLFGTKSFGRTRTIEEKKALAINVLNRANTRNRSISHHNSSDIKELFKKDQLSVYGYLENGFVVISNSDENIPIIGYSFDSFTVKDNPALNEWLESANSGLKNKKALLSEESIKIPENLKPHVDPLITTKWHQSEPYNLKCPTVTNKSGKTKHCLTGCVPTALAQIMNFHKYPEYGRGYKVYNSYIYDSQKKFEVSCDFENTRFDWNNMKDSYIDNYTPREADAVATLMYAIGVPSCTFYGIYTTMSSNVDLSNFKYSYKRLQREILEDDEFWMIKIYSNLSDSLPLYYSSSRHAYVIDGYDKDGNVHINWGWGNGDGFYNLTVTDWKKNETKDEIYCDIVPEPLNQKTVKHVHVTDAGSLSSTMAFKDLVNCDKLVITGFLNGDDFKYLNNLCYRTVRSYDGKKPSFLETIDLSETIIQPGGSKNYQTGDCSFGESLMSKMGLIHVIMPSNLESVDQSCFSENNLVEISFPTTLRSIGKAAFSYNKIENVDIPSHILYIGDSPFTGNPLETIRVDIDNKKYDSRDGCNAIMETFSNKLIQACRNTVIPQNTTVIGDLSFYEINDIYSVRIPQSVKEIGRWGFGNCSQLCYANLPDSLISIGDYAFMNTSLLAVYIPSSLANLGHRPFALSNLKSIRVHPDNKKYDSRDDCNSIVETGSNTLLYGCQNTFIPKSVVSIGDHAFRDCFTLKSIYIPSNVMSLGDFSFCQCFALKTVFSNISNPFPISESCFSSCSIDTLYVPIGSKEKYLSTEGWKNVRFKEIIELKMYDEDHMNPSDHFSIDIPIKLKAKNYVIKYGDHLPDFGFECDNDQVDIIGKPEFVCEAKQSSLPGKYRISIRQGSVINSNVTFEDGMLIIEKAPLFLKVEDSFIHEGEPIPDLPISYEGFKLREDEKILSSLPNVMTLANETSSFGEYPINITVPKSDRYDISVVESKLVIVTKKWVEVINEKAGQLEYMIGNDKKYAIEKLKVSGEINGSDLRLIRDMAGNNYQGVRTNGRLIHLNLLNARIVSGGEKYLDTDEIEQRGGSIMGKFSLNVEKDDLFPSFVFVCCNLHSITFPESVYTLSDRVCYDTPNLQEVCIPNGIEKINHTFMGRNNLTQIIIPTSIKSIKLRECSNLKKIIICNEHPDRVNPTFDELEDNSTLIVPKGSKESYLQCKSWDGFKNIEEQDFITVKADTITIPLGGDIPKFSYTVKGGILEGEPHFFCEPDCDKLGSYVIKLLQGTIINENVIFENGVVIVKQPSGINEASVKEDKSDIYDISGYKVCTNIESLKDLPKGIYIVNGRKVLK